jgi:hypothetical protein
MVGKLTYFLSIAAPVKTRHTNRSSLLLHPATEHAAALCQLLGAVFVLAALHQDELRAAFYKAVALEALGKIAPLY